MSGPATSSDRLAALLRSLSAVLAKTASSEVSPHQASFLDDIAEHEPPQDLRGELRACLQYAAGAVSSQHPSPFPLVAGSALMWLALLASLVVPAPEIPYDESFASGAALVAHLVGLGGIALASRASGGVARRRFLLWGVVPTVLAQLANLVTTFPHVNRIISAGDVVLRSGEVVGLLACAGLVIGLRSRSASVLSVGWATFCVSLTIVAFAHMTYGLGFARSGDPLWVAVLGLLLLGHALFLTGCARSRPDRWLLDGVVGGTRRTRR